MTTNIRPGHRAPQVRLTTPSHEDEAEFLAAVAQSRDLHHPWVFPPSDPERFGLYLRRLARRDHAGFFIRDAATGELGGVINVNHMVWAGLCSAYLGYYAFAGGAGRGLMTAGLHEVVADTFGPLQLHRLEANIQPGNERSIALVRRCGFRKEGFSPRYLKVGGEWRDHERWAITKEDFDH